MGYNSRIWCLQGDGMAIEVSDIEKLREYIRGVLGAAQHHANNVDEIVLALAGAIIARKDDSPLQVRAGRDSGDGQGHGVHVSQGKYVRTVVQSPNQAGRFETEKLSRSRSPFI